MELDLGKFQYEIEDDRDPAKQITQKHSAIALKP